MTGEPAEDPAGSAWHLDKRVPLAMIFTILMQTIGLVYWAAGLNFRVEQLEKQMTQNAPQAERVIRLEEKIGVVQDGIAEIKALLRRPLQP
jgi:hypothetical protein